MATERLQVILELVTGQYKREARNAATATAQVGESAKTSQGGIKGLSSSLDGVKSTLKGLGLAAAGTAMLAFGKDSLRAASDLQESFNAVDKTFGDAAGTIEAFGKISAEAAGLSTSEFQQLAAQTGQLLRGMGLGADEAAAKTIELTQRAADMASVMNTDVDEALLAIGSALRGETEPIRRFIGSFSIAEVEAYAMAEGLLAAGEEMDSTTRAAAAMGLILDRTANQAGDFVQTSGDMANATRTAAAQWENAKASFGEAALPIGAALVSNLASGLTEVRAKFGDEAAQVAFLMGQAIDNINEAAAAGEDPLTALGDSLLHVAQKGELTGDQFRALATAAGLSENQMAEFRDEILRQGEAMGLSEEILRELESAMNDGGAAADEAADSVSRFGGEMNQIPQSNVNRYLEDQRLAFDRAREAQEHWQEAQRGTAQLLLEAADPAIAAAGAVERYRDAQDELAGILEDTKASEEEIASAKLAVAEAALEAQAAVDEFSGNNAIRAASSLSEALGISTEEAYELLDALGLLDGRVVTTYVDTIFRSQGNQGPTGRNTQIGGRASGGAIESLRPYVVGESGPEVVIPQESGFVVNNNDVQRMIRALESGGGRGDGDINLYIQGSDLNNDIGTGLALAAIKHRVEAKRR